MTRRYEQPLKEHPGKTYSYILLSLYTVLVISCLWKYWFSALCMPVTSYMFMIMIRGVQLTFHQSLLNGNITAITANVLLGSWNKVIWAFCVSFHFMENGQNRP